jgi:hypothetical protein
LTLEIQHGVQVIHGEAIPFICREKAPEAQRGQPQRNSELQTSELPAD